MNRGHVLQLAPWRELFDTLPVLTKFFAGDPHGHGMQALLHAVDTYLRETQDHVEAGHPVVWYNLGFNSELIHALGHTCPLPIEALGVMHNLLGNLTTSLDFIDTAVAAGVPYDCCSADKLAIGAIHHNLYPSPACTVGINTPCDSQVMATQVMAEMGNAPFFPIDVPYYANDASVVHVASQLRELTTFLTSHTKRKLDIDRLREACKLSNDMTEAIWEWLEWRKHVPCAQSSKLVALTLIMQILFAGTKEGVRLARALLREARERTQLGQVFFQERARAVWYQDPVWTDMQIYDWFERDLGLTVPVDVFGYYAQEGLIDTTSEDTMFRGLAHKLVNCHPMARQFRSSFDVYLRDLLHMHEAWNADCAIFAGHIACKHAWGGIGLLRESCRKAGIPLLVFEFDMFDPRVTSHEGIFFEVERFVNEIVVPRKLRG
jgi:benzoyl-CoA reductase/2-hydroxyglutaryl-CoA dehydratase subunit BcrC/BadD/HgdB